MLRFPQESQAAGEVMTEPTARPWRVGEQIEDGRVFIEGPEGSAATELFPKDRRIVCDFVLYGDPEIDGETEANFKLIVERVNGGES